MKKLILTLAALILTFTATNSAMAADTTTTATTIITNQSDASAQNLIAISKKYQPGQRMTSLDSYIVKQSARPKVKAAGFLTFTQNYTVSKNIAINNPGAYTFKLSGSASSSSGVFTTTDRYNLTVTGSAPVGKTFIKPTSITINFYDYNFVVSGFPPMVIKALEVQKSVTCYNTTTCSLIGSSSYSDLSTLGNLAAEMIITYPNVSYTFAADVK